MYFPWKWEFGSALAKLRNFGGDEPPQTPSIRHCLRAKIIIKDETLEDVSQFSYFAAAYLTNSPMR
jgi:hypothetical protein